MSTQVSKVPVTIRMDPDGVDEIDRMAKREDRDRSSMVRILLREAMAARRTPDDFHDAVCTGPGAPAGFTCSHPSHTTTATDASHA